MTPAIDAQLAGAADEALATGQPVAVKGYVLVPDIFLLEGIASGQPVPRTWQLERSDGRSVAVYRDPREVAA